MSLFNKRFITFQYNHFSIIFLVYLIFMKHALAIPAPMSKEDLINNSDLFARIEVLSVDEKNNTAIAKYKVIGSTASNRIVHEVSKDSGTIKICWPDLPKNLLGPWSVKVHENEIVTIYLKWLSKGEQLDGKWSLYKNMSDCYGATWWNSKVLENYDNDMESRESSNDHFANQYDNQDQFKTKEEIDDQNISQYDQ